MTQFKSFNISVSQDGFMAGPNQSEENPLGVNGQILHTWAFATESFQSWHGEGGGSTGVDNDFIEAGYTNIGATVMGRNMFGPIRGPWLNDDWKGWWGPSPVFEHPVFVLTHHARETIEMGNGTKFVFVTGGVKEAYELALAAANGKDVRVGGGAQTIQQFMELNLLDSIHTAEIPVSLHSGETLFPDRDLLQRQYRKAEPIISGPVVHQTYYRM